MMGFTAGRNGGRLFEVYEKTGDVFKKQDPGYPFICSMRVDNTSFFI
jgi:hypothetical protein